MLGNKNVTKFTSHVFILTLECQTTETTDQRKTRRKSVSFSAGARPQSTEGMDWKKKISADHTDLAYRDAVSRLRSILSPRPHTSQGSTESPEQKSGAVTKNLLKSFDSPPSKKDRLTSGLRSIFSKESGAVIAPQVQTMAPSSLQRSLTFNNNSQNYIPAYLQKQPQGQLASQLPLGTDSMAEDDLFGFIEKQGAYITQLEKETKYCRDELGTMLEKVRDVISENEALHEKQKRDMLSAMIQQLDEKTDTYGHVPFEKSKSHQSDVISNSRIAELEAQLSQAKRSLRLAQEEILERRDKGSTGTADEKGSSSPNKHENAAMCELHQSQIENLTSEKDDLVETLSKFKKMVNELRDRESEAAKRVKNSLEIVEQMQMEKAQSDMETRRLKEELDRHQQRVREMIQDHSRKLHEEKMQVEKKYKQELDHLNNEMTQEIDCLTKSRLDLERQKRVEADLRREIQQKMGTIDDLRQEMQIKISHLQAELSQCLLLKSTAEHELIGSRLQAEKVERDGKQDCARLQAEINGLRKRLEQTDSDLVKSQEVIVRLNENVSQLHRESRLEGRTGSTDIPDSDFSSVFRTMEEKHSRDMTDLEQLIQVQNNLLDKLRNECKLVTDKLEETSRQNKEDLMNGLQSCMVSLQNNPMFSNPELQKVLLDDLSVILSEINEWMHNLDAYGPKESKPSESKSDDEDAQKSDEEGKNLDDNAENPNQEGEKSSEEKRDEVKEDFHDNEDKSNEPGEKSDENLTEKAPDDEDTKTDIAEKSEPKNFAEGIETMNDKLIAMNSKLLEWSNRIQDIIERFSSCSPNKADS